MILLRVQAYRAIAVFATLSAAVAVLSSPPAAVASNMVAARHFVAILTAAPHRGGLAGIVVGSRGRPMAGVCVTASALTARGRRVGVSRAAVTNVTGTFVIGGLPIGSYRLRYRHCLTSASQGALSASAASSRGIVTGGHISKLGAVTVRPRPARLAIGMPMPAQVTRLSAAQLRHHLPSKDPGGIAGTVLGPHRRHINGLCYTVYVSSRLSVGGVIGADGRYSTGKMLPPGKYPVGFSASCGFPFEPPTANWAPEWYRGKFLHSAANTVVVKAGKITRGIGGVMRRGGVISGRVTGHSGGGLGRVCVVAATRAGTGAEQVTTTRSGRYRLLGLDPGRYAIGFFPACLGESAYVPQWWPGRATQTRARLIKTGFGTVKNHIDARMVLGGTISGVVKLRNRHGRPIKGICVDASPVGPPFADDITVASDAKGRYAIRGLPAGRYSISFFPGCDNNGNYLSENYPHDVTVRLARVTGNVNAYLEPGAIVTGTVTDKSSGAGLARVCVQTVDGDSVAETGANGNYFMNQIPPGTIQIEFFNCGNNGNFAPQFYPNAPSPDRAASIKVRPGQVVSGIDAALNAGATISGTITLASGRTLSNECADAVPVSTSDSLDESIAVSHLGRYSIEDLAPGLYQVLYGSCGGPGIAGTWFMEPGHATDDETRADQIYASAGGLVAGINAVLPLGGSISGSISGPPSHRGSQVCLEISHARTGVVNVELSGATVGDTYLISGLVPGRYLVEFIPCAGENLAFQWYKRAWRRAGATPVLVRPGHTTGNVNAWLSAGGSISGRVVNKATGTPLGGVCVEAVSINQPFFGFGFTNRSGKYVVTGLNSSTYRLYLGSCGKARVIPRVTRPLRAIAGETLKGPALAMRTYQAGAISGRATIAGSSRNATNGACVDAMAVDRGLADSLANGFGTVGPGGFYRISGLVPGKYKVFFGDPFCGSGPDNLVPQWFMHASRRSQATVVSVAANRTTHGISVTLQRDGSISGKVTGPKPAKKPLAGICVQAVPVGSGATPFLAESAASNGNYLIGTLPPGRYLVEFEAHCATAGFATQWWQGATAKSDATPVTVRAGQARSGINASMTPTS